jgi:protein SCO1
MNNKTVGIVWALMLAGLRGQTPEMHHHHAAQPESERQATSISGLIIPDIELTDQHGTKVHFHTDLIKGKVVAINTIFTTCTTICPPMGVNFSRLRKLLGERAGRDVNLISISVDPGTDTPQRLDEWSKQFGDMGPGWTLLTGSKADVDTVLKALRVFTADKLEHQPVALIGGDAAGDWVHASALLTPARLQEIIQSKLLARAAQEYFTDVALVTQDGESVRFYSDLLRGKVVVINAFFSTCKGSCPKMAGVLQGLQSRLGERLGKDVFLLSFSVDPETDTPERLKAYAEGFNAKAGWLFLTGKKENVEWALYKLGNKVDKKEDHLTVFIVGNNRTGLFKKVGSERCTADDLMKIVESVVDDH